MNLALACQNNLQLKLSVAKLPFITLSPLPVWVIGTENMPVTKSLTRLIFMAASLVPTTSRIITPFNTFSGKLKV